MSRFRKMLIVCALALPVPAVVVGCGGDDEGSGLSAQEVLDETFNNDERVSSADLSLNLSGAIEGSQGGSFEASLEGPYQGDPDDPKAVPQLDWTGSLSFDAAGQSGDFSGGLTVTEDNAFVEYGGQAYELGTKTFGQFRDLIETAADQQTQTEGLSIEEAFKQACEQQLQAAGATDTAACDIDLSSWLSEPEDEGTEDVEGIETDHVSGGVNFETVLTDIAGLASATGQPVPPGFESQLSQFSDAVDVTYDLYSGTEDQILRGLDFSVDVDTSSIPQASASGVEGANLSFEMRLAGVNEPQTIEAPSDAQPLAQLLKQFGVPPSALNQLDQLEDLGGLGGLGGAGLGGAGGGGGGGTGNTDAYFECIQQAQTSAEIEQCTAEL